MITSAAANKPEKKIPLSHVAKARERENIKTKRARVLVIMPCVCFVCVIAACWMCLIVVSFVFQSFRSCLGIHQCYCFIVCVHRSLALSIASSTCIGVLNECCCWDDVSTLESVLLVDIIFWCHAEILVQQYNSCGTVSSRFKRAHRRVANFKCFTKIVLLRKYRWNKTYTF